MTLSCRLAFILCLGASACTVAQPPAPPAPAAPHRPTPPSAAIYRQIAANPDAARILAAIRARGLAFAPSDVSQVDQLSGAPGYAWSVGRDWLHIHVYRDRAAATAGAQVFVAGVTNPTQMIGWVGKPHLFRCGTVLALYLGESPQALDVLTHQCGAPVWMG